MAGQLTLRIIGGCDEGVVDEFRFVAGEERTFKAQVIEEVSGQRYCGLEGSTLTLVLSGTPDDITIENADITIDSECPTIFSCVLTEAQTALMITGSATLTITKAGVTRIAIKEHATKKIV